jgi:hypothetical protein
MIDEFSKAGKFLHKTKLTMMGKICKHDITNNKELEQ